MEHLDMAEAKTEKPRTLQDAIEYLDMVASKSSKLLNHSVETKEVLKNIHDRPKETEIPMDKVMKEVSTPSMVDVIIKLTDKLNSNIECTGGNIGDIQNMLR